MNKETVIAIPADPDDPEDFDVTVAGLERGLLARDLRQLRVRLGLSHADFAARYDIPAGDYELYETVQAVPPPAVFAYLRVIAAEPETVARALTRAA